MRYFFAAILLLHGFIHLLGFMKAYDIGQITQLTREISRPAGLVWLVATLLFGVTAVLYLFRYDNWPFVAIIGVVISQVLIIGVWQDAKFGTIANVIILAVAVAGYGAATFEKSFREDVARHLSQQGSPGEELVTDDDLAHLPEPVQRYLRYAGVVGKPRLRNMMVEFEGEMREKGKDWFSFTSRQYNFFEEPARLFFMKARVKGLPAVGYHAYQAGNASMQVKLFSLFPVVDIEGEELFKAETVTVFNDLCLMAPAALIDRRIRWQPLDDRSAKAWFINRGVEISAVLHFDEEGRLVNFVSDDRYDISDMQTRRFTTPVMEYARQNNGYHLISQGEAVWHYPDGPFTYGKFRVKRIMYNEKW